MSVPEQAASLQAALPRPGSNAGPLRAGPLPVGPLPVGPLRVGIAGLGTVGAGTLRLLRENASPIEARAGRPIVAVAVSARDRARDRGVATDGLRWHDDPDALAHDPDLDVVAELIGGADGPALRLVTACLERGRAVVTANKALIATHAPALAALTRRTGAVLAFEAAVAGGIPAIKLIREGLAANRFTRVAGILNGTCNHILTTMRDSGREFADVLAEAQALGYAEADPAADVDGLDTAHKLAILASLAFDRPVPLEAVHVEGIRRIGGLDIGFATELGYRVKLLGIARRTADGIEIRVHPCLVPESAPLARVDGVYNAVVAEGDFAGRMTIEGRGAGAGPTASAVVADLIEVARGRALPFVAPGRALPFVAPGRAQASVAREGAVSSDAREGAPAPDPRGSARVPGARERAVPAGVPEAADGPPLLGILAHHGAYYLRLVVLDRPGVIAEVAAALRDAHVSLKSMLQHGRAPGEAVPIVLVTHEVGEVAMRDAVARIAALDIVVEAPLVLRIEPG